MLSTELVTNDYKDTEDQYGSMLSHIDYTVFLTCAVTNTDTVWKVRSPHLVHNEGLLLIQLKTGYCSTAHNQFNVLVPSYAASQQRSQHNLVYCWQCFWCVVRKSWVFQTYTHPSLIFSTRAV